MPIYEYSCESCGHEMDALQKVSDPVLADCPACQEPALVKRISAPSFRLKGGGWYETDFKTDNKRNIAGEQSESKKEDKADSGKTKSAGDPPKSAEGD